MSAVLYLPTHRRSVEPQRSLLPSFDKVGMTPLGPDTSFDTFRRRHLCPFLPFLSAGAVATQDLISPPCNCRIVDATESNKVKAKPQDLGCCVNHEIIVDLIIAIAGSRFYHDVV
jgi:hypothetical protein